MRKLDEKKVERSRTAFFGVNLRAAEAGKKKKTPEHQKKKVLFLLFLFF